MSSLVIGVGKAVSDSTTTIPISIRTNLVVRLRDMSEISSGDKMICKNMYHLRDQDLAQLLSKTVKNPHYRSAGAMELYALTDVISMVVKNMDQLTI